MDEVVDALDVWVGWAFVVLVVIFAVYGYIRYGLDGPPERRKEDGEGEKSFGGRVEAVGGFLAGESLGMVGCGGVFLAVAVGLFVVAAVVGMLL